MAKKNSLKERNFLLKIISLIERNNPKFSTMNRISLCKKIFPMENDEKKNFSRSLAYVTVKIHDRII